MARMAGWHILYHRTSCSVCKSGEVTKSNDHSDGLGISQREVSHCAMHHLFLMGFILLSLILIALLILLLLLILK